ncbi:hypothetical protein [Streptomyces sp. NPDC001500]
MKMNRASWSWLEFVALVGGGLGGGWVAYDRYPHNSSPIPIAASLVGLTIGALIAGMAIMARSHDAEFLNSLHDAGVSRASMFFAPFITTATIGILAIVAILIYSVLPAHLASGWRAVSGAFCGGLTLLTLSGLTAAIGTLVQYVDFYEITKTHERDK